MTLTELFNFTSLVWFVFHLWTWRKKNWQKWLKRVWLFDSTDPRVEFMWVQPKDCLHYGKKKQETWAEETDKNLKEKVPHRTTRLYPPKTLKFSTPRSGLSVPTRPLLFRGSFPTVLFGVFSVYKGLAETELAKAHRASIHRAAAAGLFRAIILKQK